MKEGRFYIVLFTMQIPDQGITERLKELGDWMNCFPGAYVVYSTFSPKQIFTRLGRPTSERLLILETTIESYWGVMPKEVWEWMKQHSLKASTR